MKLFSDPFELRNYKFLPSRLKAKVAAFIAQLDEQSRKFAIGKYVLGQTLSEVAEAMGYAERSIYPFRNRVIMLWNTYTNQERLDYHRIRIVHLLAKHGQLHHSKLLMNLNLKRSGLDLNEFHELMETMILANHIQCQTDYPRHGGRPKRFYSLCCQPEFVYNL